MSMKFRSRAQRRYTLTVGIAMMCYMLSLSVALHVLGRGTPQRTDAVAWLLALIPGLSVAAVFVAYGRMLIEETDEYVRMVLTRQSLIATGFTLTIVTIYGFLENFGLVGHIDAFYTAILWFVGLGVGALWNSLTLGAKGN